MSELLPKFGIPSKDEINVESDNYQVKGPYREACDICLKPFDREPKIRCAECLTTTLICMQCFSLGLETQSHRCNHNYHIDCRHIPIASDTDWSLQEDYDLLQSVLENGYGNYLGLNKSFMHRNVEEIRIRIDELLELDKAPLRACLQIGPRPVIPYNAEISKQEPPRFPYRSQNAKQLAGYCAPRGDFESEHANNAEEMLKHLDVDSDSDEEDDNGLGEEMTCALVACYNEKLRERALRKQIVKNYGLICKRMQYMMSLNQSLAVFAQFMDLEDYDRLNEGLKSEMAVRTRMRRLQKYRALGITRRRGCILYEKLQAIRSQESKNLQKTMQLLVQPNGAVRFKKITKSAPLDLSPFNGYELLSPRERELCSSIRLFPEKFLSYKNCLINMNREDGGVRLMTARSLFKIDVNKTRQIFNLLRDEGLINAL